MRKPIIFMLTFMLTLSLVVFNVKATSSHPKVSADGVVLMDATTGKILYSKNADTQYPPASTTKIMTALLTLEKTNLDDVVTVGKNPPLADGSRIYIFEGEKLKISDLLYALLLQSANDAAEALAEHISGSKSEFASLMNKRALELGCKNTNFVNPHGLYDDKHRTTARDLALILKELSSHEDFKKIATKSIHYIEPTNKCTEKRPLWNKNRLIHKNSKSYYEGCEGGKTGYTAQSKHSFVAAASRNGQKLIAVLLHDKEHTYWEDVRKLFDYGFNNFTLETFHSKGDSIGEYKIEDNLNIPIISNENFYYVKEKGSTKIPKLKINPKDLSKTSFNKGANILTANVTYDNKNIGKLNLASGADYSPKTSILNLINDHNSPLSKWLKLSSFGLGSLVAIIFLMKMKKRARRNKH